MNLQAPLIFQTAQGTPQARSKEDIELLLLKSCQSVLSSCVAAAGDIIGFVLTILVLFIAAGGGIGGGGAIIPLYLLFLGE